jgi:choline-phosphate cytidylyltransferase
VVHDEAPYTSIGQEDIYAGVKKMGKFLPSYRTEGISTSDLITRVLKNKHAYFIRNLNRGISTEEVGLTWIEE